MRRLILAEPGLRRTTGHEHAHARVLAAECARRGIKFELLASAQATDSAITGLPAQRTFRVSVYARAPAAGRVAALEAARKWSRKFRKDFETALGALQAGPEDLLLLNTVKVPVVAGISRWLSERPERLRPSVAVALRLGAEEGLPDRLMPDLSRWLYRRLLLRLQRLLGDRLLLVSDTRLIGDEFARLAGRSVASIPLPIDVPEARPPDPSADLVRLVFPSSGVDRGFQLLPRAFASTLLRNPSLVATVRLPLHRRDGDETAIRQLEEMAPRVKLIDGPLAEAAFYELLSDADAVLLPYDPDVFAKRSSQILAQSAAVGRPVIVVAGTFLDHACRSTGIVSVTAEAFTPEALAEAICRFVDRRELLIRDAWEACPIQRRRHSAAGFLDQLVEFTNGHRSSAPSVAA